MAAFLGIAALMAAALPAQASGSAQVEGGTTIDGRYTGTYTVQTIRTPPEDAELGIVLTPGDVLSFDLDLTTSSAGGGEAVFTWYYEGAAFLTLSAPLTWDGTQLEINLHSEGAFEEDWHFSGTASRTDDTVTITGTWSACCTAFPTGVWEVTRVPAEAGGTTSTTQPGGAGEEVSTTAPSSTTVTSQPATEDGETPGAGEAAPGSPPSGDAGVFPKGGWSPAGVAVLILVIILILIATGMGVKGATAAALAAVMEKLPDRGAAPKVREIGPAVRELGRQLVGSEDKPVTVSGPVQPWSQPDTATPRAGFVLQPGGRYTVMASTGPGPDHWVLVRSDSAGVEGWVHRSALAPWQEEIPTAWTPAPTAAWERVHFPNPFETRVPGGNRWRYEPGEYRLGPPDQNGYRPITDAAGELLPGTIHASQVPPPPNQPTGGVEGAPPPPPPPPPSP